MPTARDVPDTGTRASDLSDGSKGIPRMPSCTEYSRKEPTPTADTQNCLFFGSEFALRYTSVTLDRSSLLIWLNQRRIFVYKHVVPSQDCCPVRRLYPAVHIQALVVGEVGRHSWEQSPLLLLQRLVPRNTKEENEYTKQNQRGVDGDMNRCALHKQTPQSKQTSDKKRTFSPPPLFIYFLAFAK